MRFTLRCAFLALALLSLPVAAASAAPVTFGSGHLDWGVKQSFRSYIEGPIAKGSYSAFDGASKNADGTIRFDVLGGAYDDATGVGELLIDGTARFTGHGGALDLTYSNLRVVFSGGGAGTLFADAISKENVPGAVAKPYPNTPLVSLTVPPATSTADGLTWAPVPAKLTAEGSPAFGSFYTAGMDFDPLDPLVAVFGVPRARPNRTPPPPPAPPTVKPPTFEAVKGAVSVGKAGVATIATLRCGTAACAVKAPKWVKVKIDGKRYKVKVLAPKALKPRRSAKLRVKLPRAARAALAGRRAKVKVKVTLVAGGAKASKTVRAILKLKKKKKKNANAGATRRRNG